MKLKRLLSVLDVLECTADPELDVRDISFDSRTTQPGDGRRRMSLISAWPTAALHCRASAANFSATRRVS